MNQNGETFGAIDYIRLESRYWDLWILARKAELTTPSSQQSNTVFTTTDTELQSTVLAPVGRLSVLSSSLTGIGGQLSHTAGSTTNSHDDTRRKLNINKTRQFHSKHYTQLEIKSNNTTSPQSSNENETSCHRNISAWKMSDVSPPTTPDPDPSNAMDIVNPGSCPKHLIVNIPRENDTRSDIPISHQNPTMSPSTITTNPSNNCITNTGDGNSSIIFSDKRTASTCDNNAIKITSANSFYSSNRDDGHHYRRKTATPIQSFSTECNKPTLIQSHNGSSYIITLGNEHPPSLPPPQPPPLGIKKNLLLL